jgi:hypothetical protein
VKSRLVLSACVPFTAADCLILLVMALASALAAWLDRKS